MTMSAQAAAMTNDIRESRISLLALSGSPLAVIRRDGCALEPELMAFATLLHRERSSVGARIRTRKPRHLVLRFVVGIFSFAMNFIARQKRFVGAIRENKVAQEKRRIPDRSKRVNHVLPVAGRGVARVFRPRQATHSRYQQNQQYPNPFHLRTVFKILDWVKASDFERVGFNLIPRPPTL